MVKILFVCLGNICRSPSAEGVFKKITNESGHTDSLFIDSAGTSAYHVGERADSRMRKHASKRFYELTSLSRKFEKEDFKEFTYIIAMDKINYKDIVELDKNNEFRNKIKLMTDFSTKYFNIDVPDPYYGGSEGFEEVLDILEESCSGFLNYLKDSNEI